VDSAREMESGCVTSKDINCELDFVGVENSYRLFERRVKASTTRNLTQCQVQSLIHQGPSPCRTVLSTAVERRGAPTTSAKHFS
jgi:hypothetical protein